MSKNLPQMDMGKSFSSLQDKQKELSRASHLTYVKTTEIAADWLNSLETDIETLVDIGSHSGSFVQGLITRSDKLRETTKIAVDSTQSVLDELSCKNKITANALDLPLEDNSMDLTILRYVVQWNHQEKQLPIMQEALRVTKKFLLFQVPVVTKEDAPFFERILQTSTIERLQRPHGFYFPQHDYLIDLLGKLEAQVTPLESVEVSNIVDIFEDRYHLTAEEKETVQSEFQGHDNWRIESYILEK